MKDLSGRWRVLMWSAARRLPHQEKVRTMTNPATMTDAERAKLEARRERLMKLMREGAGTLDADDLEDLQQEWTKIDNQLNRSR